MLPIIFEGPFMKLKSIIIISVSLLIYSCDGPENNDIVPDVPDVPNDTLKTDSTNIILIIADDLGTDIFSVPGIKERVPNIKDFASKSVVFNNAYVTSASCSPSRSSMLTGLYPHQNGQLGLSREAEGFKIQDWVTTLPEVLNNNGYYTGYIGKLHLLPVEKYQTHYQKLDWNDTKRKTKVEQNVNEFLDSAGEKTFFLTLSLFDPHVRWEDALFVDQVDGIPATVYGPEDVNPLPYQMINNTEELARIAGYSNSIARLDEIFGAVMKIIENRDLKKNTIIIFLGDNGSPFCRSKASAYENGIRVPFIISYPSEKSTPHQYDGLVSTIDLMPTLLEVTKSTIDYDLPGKSLIGALEGDNRPLREELFTEFNYHYYLNYYPRRSIRQGDFKLIYNPNYLEKFPFKAIDKDPAFNLSRLPQYDNTFARIIFNNYVKPAEYELYNIEDDPHEFYNLANDNGYQNIKVELQEKLKDWMQATNDTLRIE